MYIETGVSGVNKANNIEENSQKKNTGATNPIANADYEDPYKQKAKVSSELALATLLPKENLSKSETFKIKEEIKRLEQDLKYQMAHPPKSRDNTDWGYYNIYMDRLQKKIAQLREKCPLERTNLDDVLMTKPSNFFEPNQADNIKGKGISFIQVVPTDKESLAKVTYTAVPVFTNARTIEEMVRLGKRDGINIETVKLDDGEYHTVVKNIWDQGPLDSAKGYFEIDKPCVVMNYGKYDANDPYVNQEWAKDNQDSDGKITDCAVVANSNDVAILKKSYVHSDGDRIDDKDMHRWGGFPVHKDGNATVNAVAFETPQKLNTLEGPIETDVTMGDVEGYVYNNFKELKKQIIKNKIAANPDDPNSQAFVDLIKSGKDEEALALLKKVTAESYDVA